MYQLIKAYLTQSAQFRTRLMLGALLIVCCSATPSFAQKPPAIPHKPPSVPQSVGHRKCCNRPEVFLLRGGAGYWPKVAEFEAALEARGFAPKTIYHWQHRGLADEITSAYKAGELAGPVTIVGYSSGADAACWMSERLNKSGVPVTNLILIESTFGIAVPTNVSYCVNIYQSRGWTDKIPAFRGIPVAKYNPNTELHNINVKYHPDLAVLAERNHFTMGVASEMHTYLGDILVQRNPQLQIGARAVGEDQGSSDGEGSDKEARLPNAETIQR